MLSPSQLVPINQALAPHELKLVLEQTTPTVLTARYQWANETVGTIDLAQVGIATNHHTSLLQIQLLGNWWENRLQPRYEHELSDLRHLPSQLLEIGCQLYWIWQQPLGSALFQQPAAKEN